MCKEVITVIISITTILISVATFTIAYSQMRIASAKTKLDLYNKRFNVYATALDYFHATWDQPHEKIKERGNQFNKSYRESQFLFEPSDGVYEALGKIKQNGSTIHFYEQHKYERENNLTKDRHDLSKLLDASVIARYDFEKNLQNLERQIEKYIQFKTITGWKFFQ